VLRVRKEQMAELSRVAVEDFVERARDHLREIDFARTAAMTDAEVDALTRQALSRAPVYGMESEYEIARFAELLLSLGPAFDETPGASEILIDTDTDGVERLDAVLRFYRDPPALEVAS
jgi:hypothetical protein